MKELEYEVRSKVSNSDPRRNLPASELVEQKDYKARFDDLYGISRKKHIRLLEENLIPQLFDSEKKNN
jgi:hypothetical protein